MSLIEDVPPAFRYMVNEAAHDQDTTPTTIEGSHGSRRVHVIYLPDAMGEACDQAEAARELAGEGLDEWEYTWRAERYRRGMLVVGVRR